MSGQMQRQTFTGSGTFTPDANTSLVWITMIAGGAGGAGASQLETPVGAVSGGSGEYVFRLAVTVVPSVGVTVTVGAGGLGGVPISTSGPTLGATGGDTSFGAWAVKGGICKGSGITGGGPDGGISGAPGVPGTLEGPPWFGGGGASTGGNASIQVGNVGSPDPGIFPGAAGGATNAGGGAQSGGGGGAASPWGIGGAGGSGGDNIGTPLIHSVGWGHDAPATSYGAGGGGSGSAFTSAHQKPGGAGAPGIVYVFFVG